MSNQPMSSRLLAQPSPAGAAAEPRSDAQRIAAALERIEAVIRREPATIAELRADLAEVVETVAALRAAVDAAGQRYTEIGALLQDLERRMLRMTMLLGPAPESAAPAAQEPERPADEQAFLDAIGVDTPPGAAPSAEADRVPTVSEVVSQLGRSDAAAEQPDAAAGHATAVAMLEAMVGELAVAMPAAAPAASNEADRDAAEDRAPAPPPDFTQLDDMPYFAAELGTAVIFDPTPGPAEPAPQSEPEPGETDAEPDTEPGETDADLGETDEIATDSDLDALLFEPPPPQAEPDPAVLLLEPASAPSEPAPQSISDLPESHPQAAAAAFDPPMPGHPLVIEAPLPPPPAAWDIELPVPANARRQSEPPAAWQVEPPAAAPAALPHRPGSAAGAAVDPLAALNAMSDEEKIALFE
jgi:hypothetical protein